MHKCRWESHLDTSSLRKIVLRQIPLVQSRLRYLHVGL